MQDGRALLHCRTAHTLGVTGVHRSCVTHLGCVPTQQLHTQPSTVCHWLCSVAAATCLHAHVFSLLECSHAHLRMSVRAR
jgi:hypothetical protein